MNSGLNPNDFLRNLSVEEVPEETVTRLEAFSGAELTLLVEEARDLLGQPVHAGHDEMAPEGWAYHGILLASHQMCALTAGTSLNAQAVSDVWLWYSLLVLYELRQVGDETP